MTERSKHTPDPNTPQADEVRDMFEQASPPEPQRVIQRVRRTSPYLSADEAPAPKPRPSETRRSPYADDASPVKPTQRAQRAAEAKPERRSPYATDTRTTRAPVASSRSERILIDLKPSRLSLRDRMSLARLKGSEAVNRIIFLPTDAVVTLKPGAEFGEFRSQSWAQTGLETLGFAWEDLRRNSRHLPVQKIARTVGTYALIVAAVFALFNLPGIARQIEFILSPPTATGETAAPKAVPTPQAQPAPTEEYRILIPKIGVDAPVVLSQSRHWDQMKEELSRGVVHYAGTARPGESGNVGLTGHSSNYWWDKGAYNYVFTNLDKLAPGDEVTLYHAGLTYRYRMTGSRVVPPEQAEVLAPTPTNQLTLITCWPRFTDWKRLVVSLEQIDPPAPAAQGGGNRLPDA